MSKNSSTLLSNRVRVVSESAGISIVVEFIVLKPTLAAVRVTYQLTLSDSAPESVRAMFGSKEIEGFAAPESINSFIDHKVAEIAFDPKFKLMPMSFIEDTHKLGFAAALERAENWLSAANQGYAKLIEEEFTLSNLVQIDFGSHMLFDHEGQILPKAFTFNYINGEIKDGRYDLAKLIELLKDDPRVTPLFEKRTSHLQQDPGVLSIHQVPSYNVSPGCNAYVPFLFSPTKEDMQKMWEKAKSYQTIYPSTKLVEAMEDLDILGLSAGGATRFDREE